MPPQFQYSPLEVAMALSLYSYNVSPVERAQKLYDHFQGDCVELEDLVNIIMLEPANLATALAAPTAKVYVDHALDRYGVEALERVVANLGSRV